MSETSLAGFIQDNREELIERCRSKTGELVNSLSIEGYARGVPLFLDQLVGELHKAASQTREIRNGATAYGQALFFKGFTVQEVVHAYGNICQSVTDLIVEADAPIEAEAFRTLNRCLDDAIAAAVSEYTRQQRVVNGSEVTQLVALVEAALTLLQAVETGEVGVKGKSGVFLHRTLDTIRTRLDAMSTLAVSPS